MNYGETSDCGNSSSQLGIPKDKEGIDKDRVHQVPIMIPVQLGSLQLSVILCALRQVSFDT